MTYVYKNRSAQDWMHYIRKKELNKALEFFPEGNKLKILDLGGGDGYIASLIAERGHEVKSIDIDPRFPQHFHVQKVSDSKLPFSNAYFDIIFSSNVLEHVTDLKVLLRELKRVGNKDVLMIHIMPTPAWRIITAIEGIIKLFIFINKKVFTYNRQVPDEKFGDGNHQPKKKNSPFVRAWKYIIRPHGEFPTAFHEILAYSPRSWRKVFVKNGLEVISVEPLPVIHGIGFFRWKLKRMRSWLASRYTATSMLYFIRRANQRSVV